MSARLRALRYGPASYDYVKQSDTIKYKYLTMYNIYNNGKKMKPPWEYFNESKAEFIMLYFADVRQKYDDNLKYTRTHIIKRSSSF
jgi:hypothetical protein